jgi:PAS domain S-box-containing protein
MVRGVDSAGDDNGKKRERAEAASLISFLRLELRILLLAERGAELPQILGEITASFERRHPAMRVSILLLGDDGQLWPGSVASLPDAWVEAITPLPVGERIGSCGAAVFHRRRVVTSDIGGDPNWAGYRQVAVANGLRACWSEPIIGLDGEVLGTFAIYYDEPRTPQESELELVELGAHLARTAIERHREARQRRALLEEMRQAEERMRLALEIARLGTFHYDATANRVRVDERMRAMLGDPSGPEEISLDESLRRIHPEDRGAVEQALAGAVIPGSHGRYGVEFRIVWDDGSEHWLTLNGRARFVEEDGQPRFVALLGTALDVTAQKRAEQALRAANRQKDAFLAALGHELRNPLAPILNAAHLLERTATEVPEIERAAAVIVRQANHMANLLNDLLDVARIARGRIELDLEPVDLYALVRSMIADHRGSFEAAGIRLVARIPDGDGDGARHGDGARDGQALVRADSTRVRQMLGNLLNNALKFSEPGGTVTVTAAADDGTVRIEVRDTGLGIDRDRLGEILDRAGYPAHPHPDPQRGGLGLGLAVAGSLAEQHGGSLTASSEGAGKGSTFVLSLPRASE